MNRDNRLHIQYTALGLIAPRLKSELITKVSERHSHVDTSEISEVIDNLLREDMLSIAPYTGQISPTYEGAFLHSSLEAIIDCGEKSLEALWLLNLVEKTSATKAKGIFVSTIEDKTKAEEAFNEFIKQDLLRITFANDVEVVLTEKGRALVA